MTAITANKFPVKSVIDGRPTTRGYRVPSVGSRLLAQEPNEPGKLPVTTGRGGPGTWTAGWRGSSCATPEHELKRLLSADLAPQRRESDAPVSAGDTLVDLISGIVVMLAIIAFGFSLIGFFS